ncbi:MAG: AraC family transcriptional regulator, partial [Chitinophagaceae bacterium]
MDLIIKTSTNKNIVLHPSMPAGVPSNLPGSKSWSSQSDFGTIQYEEIQNGGFTVRSTFFQLKKKMTLYCRMQHPLAGVRIAVFNKWNFALNGAEGVQLQKNQFIIYYAGKRGEKITFEKDKEYRSFELLCEPEILAGLLKLFPSIAALMEEVTSDKTAFLQQKPLWAPHNALDIVKDTPDFSSGDILKTLFSFLLEAVQGKLVEEVPIEQEVAAAYKARDLILADITRHYPIPEIARKVNLNENRLKFVFKHVFGNSIYQYLLDARMKKAIHLLQATTKPMEKIARLTGYKRLTSFIT